jgi:hypothetical protein
MRKEHFTLKKSAFTSTFSSGFPSGIRSGPSKFIGTLRIGYSAFNQIDPDGNSIASIGRERINLMQRP